jgi:hypothetical protein
LVGAGIRENFQGNAFGRQCNWTHEDYTAGSRTEKHEEI